MKRGLVVSAFAALVAAGWDTSFAGDLERVVVADVTLVNNGEGASRLLFRLPLGMRSERRMVQRATLTIPFEGQVELKSIELRVCPVTEPWPNGASWSTEFDADLFAPARVDFRTGSGRATFDLTVLMKEILEEGMLADGFALMIASDVVSGFTDSDADRFGVLEGAELDLVTALLPSGRPRTRELRK